LESDENIRISFTSNIEENIKIILIVISQALFRRNQVEAFIKNIHKKTEKNLTVGHTELIVTHWTCVMYGAGEGRRP